MVNRPIVVQISGLKKSYQLGQIGNGTLAADLQSWWSRVRGKEDPNMPLGYDSRLIGKTFWALNGLDLTIRKGEAVGIIGRNGAGKSTLLKILSHITLPTQGAVGINGRISSMLEVGTGFSPEMTGRENIYMNGTILGMNRSEIDIRMQEIIDFSECGEFIDTPVKRYSSGMYVKLAFSVSAFLDSEIIIMDEVLAVGDAAFQRKCLERMKTAASIEGRTVLYVSHNMSTIRKLCTRCVVLSEGKCIYDGNVEKAIDLYLGQSEEAPACSDLTEAVRPVQSLIDYPEIQMHSIGILSGNYAIVEQGEKINMELKWDCKRFMIMRKICFRIIIKASDGEPVGMVRTPILQTPSTGLYTTRFCWDVSFLTPGKYYADLFLSDIENDAIVNFDAIASGFQFEISARSTGSNTIKWVTSAWGRIEFPPIKVESQEISALGELPI